MHMVIADYCTVHRACANIAGVCDVFTVVIAQAREIAEIADCCTVHLHMSTCFDAVVLVVALPVRKGHTASDEGRHANPSPSRLPSGLICMHACVCVFVTVLLRFAIWWVCRVMYACIMVLNAHTRDCVCDCVCMCVCV